MSADPHVRIAASEGSQASVMHGPSEVGRAPRRQAPRPAFGERFLQPPRRVPGHHRSVPWGAVELDIELSGGPYRFAGLSRTQGAAVRARFGELVTAVGPRPEPAVEARVFRVPSGRFTTFESYDWQYTMEFDYRPHSVAVAGPEVMARLEWSKERDQAQKPAGRLRGSLWTCAEQGGGFQRVFENFFRLVVAYRLLDCGGVLLHSAGVLDRGGAVLFFGHSGAGKSTVSRLSLDTGRQVLSDDLNALSDVGRGTMVQQVPFAGELGQCLPRGGRHPLHGLYRLEKGAFHALRSLSRARLVASLIACSPYVNRDPFRIERLVENLDLLVDRVPARCLQFARDPGFWELLQKQDRLP